MAETTLFGKKINLPSFGKKTAAVAVDPEARNQEINEQIQNFTPGIPATNLLPAEVTEQYRVEGMRNKFILAAFAIMIVLALLFVGTMLVEARAEQRLADLQEENSTLTATLQDLSVYKNYVESVDAKRSGLFTQFQGDIQYAQIADMITGAAERSGVQITDMSFGAAGGASGTSPDVATCASPDPFNPSAAVGCISITARAGDIGSVASFTQALEDQPMFVYPYFPSATIGEEGVDLSGSVGFTSEAAAVRYPDMTLPVLDQLVSVEVGPPATQEEPPVDPLLTPPADNPAEGE